MLARFHELSNEVSCFLRSRQQIVLENCMLIPDFNIYVAYLADFFDAINELNKKLQGPFSNIIVQHDKVQTFIAKIHLWRHDIEDGNAAAFGRLNLLLHGSSCNEEVLCEIKEHLDSLVDEFDRYFPGIDNEDIMFQLTRNPFNRNSTRLPLSVQDEFLELINDSFAKDDYEVLDLSDFWIKMRGPYPTLAQHALSILLPFSSTYLCETGFSSLLVIKSKARNRLRVESDLRCALSKTSPRVELLVSRKQIQQSH